jgi:hypothetical protein
MNGVHRGWNTPPTPDAAYPKLAGANKDDAYSLYFSAPTQFIRTRRGTTNGESLRGLSAMRGPIQDAAFIRVSNPSAFAALHDARPASHASFMAFRLTPTLLRCNNLTSQFLEPFAWTVP